MPDGTASSYHYCVISILTRSPNFFSRQSLQNPSTHSLRRGVATPHAAVEYRPSGEFECILFCTLSVLYLYSICTLSVFYLYSICTLSVLYLYSICTLSALHGLKMSQDPGMFIHNIMMSGEIQKQPFTIQQNGVTCLESKQYTIIPTDKEQIVSWSDGDGNRWTIRIPHKKTPIRRDLWKPTNC